MIVWGDRRVTLTAWAGKQQPFVIFHLAPSLYWNRGLAGSFHVCVLGAGFVVRTYRWPNKNQQG